LKLHQSPASPYARKVIMCAHELGLLPKIELTKTMPQSDDSYGKINPIHRIPALELDDGLVLFDSRVICEYLDSIGGNKLFPASGLGRFRVLRLQAMADGLCDAAVPRRQEMLRAPEKQSKEFLASRERMIRQICDAWEESVDQLQGVNIGTIATAAALGYLDFRFPDDEWRKTRPKLAKWHEEFAKRPSYQATMPA
jgi:glutathione S-transferase